MAPFTIEDIKKAFYGAEKKPVENLPVHGAVLRRLQLDERIFENGYTKVKRPNGKLKPITVFISKEYRARQQGNRLAPYKDQGQLF